MDYKTVMVSLALDRPNGACLAVAGDLAERFGARVIGIAASDVKPPLYFADGDYAQKLLDEEATAVRGRLSELEAEFRTAVEKRTKSVEWRSGQTLPVPYVLQQARTADVLVVGARSETIVDPCAAADPSDLVMQAGRPLIVVPPAVEWFDFRSVLVAWKDVREARRAVFDALPILAAAKDVTIVEIAEQGTRRADALSHVADVASWLHGHGIVASTFVPESAAEIPEQLNRIAADVGAGPVVAGAYGHSRLREWILGGVTRHLATESGRCAFLSR
ncbi:universal stress protein [Bradyrhizobium sp. AUGA SZCCT0177]|uniref:universal stress protein n=1 Tax=Bradyrhizobium sp. AUGA SZCCT0177 TaxID=2807665 RepID=UPI001BAA1814|nr:universal stress protein [Bradyrhizobium sp. AUGA SZCCT0177]MBR1282890.1 universal stress protein [Bradyrhizobium sp. AUGA SZCCT0177]